MRWRKRPVNALGRFVVVEREAARVRSGKGVRRRTERRCIKERPPWVRSTAGAGRAKRAHAALNDLNDDGEKNNTCEDSRRSK